MRVSSSLGSVQRRGVCLHVRYEVDIFRGVQFCAVLAIKTWVWTGIADPSLWISTKLSASFTFSDTPYQFYCPKHLKLNRVLLKF